MPDLTVITTTYNRADCLHYCYSSLKKQTCMDFQWLVVDDGSTDDTRNVIKQFQDTPHVFEIDYIYKENGGKHTALNTAHPYIRGKYVLILDSDDALTADAVEFVLEKWKLWTNDPDVGQLIFLKGKDINSPICYVKNAEKKVDILREDRICNGGRDCCEVFRKELFTKYPFPVFPGEKFIGEGAAFYFIERSSKGVYYNRILYICNYRDDGLTKAGRQMRIRNPLGGKFNSNLYMDKRLPTKTRIKKAMLYVCYAKFSGDTLSNIITGTTHRLLVAAAIIPGSILYLFWKIKYKENKAC